MPDVGTLGGSEKFLDIPNSSHILEENFLWTIR
jgi:hypothetical protein